MIPYKLLTELVNNYYLVFRLTNPDTEFKLVHSRNGLQWAPKWPTGSGNVSTPRFLGVLSNFRTPSMRKGLDGQ